MKKFTMTIDLNFNDEDGLGLRISHEGLNITDPVDAAICIMFREALEKQAELAANLAVKYGEAVATIVAYEEGEI